MADNVGVVGLLLLGCISVGAGALLYNKQLDLEAERLRVASENELHARRVKCAEDGKKFAAESLDSERAGLAPQHDTLWDDPEFHFSVERGACLVRTRFVWVGAITYQHARVTDLTTNTAVIESYVSLKPDPGKPDGGMKEELFDMPTGGPNLSRQDFVKRAAVVMSK